MHSCSCAICRQAAPHPTESCAHAHTQEHTHTHEHMHMHAHMQTHTLMRACTRLSGQPCGLTSASHAPHAATSHSAGSPCPAHSECCQPAASRVRTAAQSGLHSVRRTRPLARINRPVGARPNAGRRRNATAQPSQCAVIAEGGRAVLRVGSGVLKLCRTARGPWRALQMMGENNAAHARRAYTPAETLAAERAQSRLALPAPHRCWDWAHPVPHRCWD